MRFWSRIITVIIFFIVGHHLVNGQSSLLNTQGSPRLVVVINIEQMRTDYLTRYWDKFQEGGFKRLVNEGAICSNADINLHIQSPFTGVPTLFSGVYPDRHGIISESWYDRLREKEINAVEDDYYFTVGSDSDEGKRSAAQMLSPTIGDIMKLNTGGKAKVFSVSLNDYSAILSAGHSADGAYWMDNQTGNMISTSYYINQFPTWVLEFNNKKLAELYIGRDWSTFHPDGSYTESWDDDYSLEKGYYSEWNTFPYNLNRLMRRAGSYKVIKTTPYGNSIVRDFAVSLIEKENMGKDDVPDLLTINFSSLDYENGSFGPLSVEMQDTYLRLDQDISVLLNYIDSNIGLENTMIVLTSSCSAMYPADYMRDEFNMPVGYVSPENIVALLKSYLNITYGQGDWVLFEGNQQLYLNRELIEDLGLDLEEVQQKVATFINDFEGVKIALPASDFEKGDFIKSPLLTISKSFNFKRSGDVLYVLENGWQPQYKYKRTNYNDESHIPMIWLGKRVKNFRDTEQVDAVDMVPTLLEVLGFDIPGYFEGRILTEILQ